MPRGRAQAALSPGLRQWVSLEQTVHHRVDRALLEPGTVSSLPFELRPEAGQPFVLHSAWLSPSQRRSFGSAPAGLRHHERHLWLWHPLHPAACALARQLPPGPSFTAYVTSSARTVLCSRPGATPFFAKLSLPLELAGEPRVLDGHHALTATFASRLVSRLGAGAGFTFFPEPYAVVPRRAPNAALIVRTLRPGRWAPFFSFTGPAAPRRPLHFWRALVTALVDAWATAAIRAGLALELHAQNLLVQLDARGNPTGRFGYRDLDGLRADACFLERKSASLARLVDEGHGLRVATFDEPDAALAASLERYLLGGPAAGIGDNLGHRELGQSLVLEAVQRRLDVDASRPGELVARVAVLRAKQLRAPPLPRFVRRFIAREQGANERLRNPRWFASVDHTALPASFDPSSKPVFALDALELAPSQVEALGKTWPLLSVRRRGRQLTRVLVHPFMRERLGLLTAEVPLRASPFFATPTSSPRSLVVWNRRGDAFGLKLSLDVELLGLSRLIHGSKLRRAMAVAACLRLVGRRQRAQVRFEVLDEPAALRVVERDDGSLIRDLRPLRGRDVVPGFGLGPLLAACPLPVALKSVRTAIEALARVNGYLFFQLGLVGQLHQQNVLFGVDRAGQLDGSLLLRDLDSFCVDPRVRALRGLELPRDEATDADLQAADASHRYDDAWNRSCRADFGFVFERCLASRGVSTARRRDAVWSAFDVALLSEAVRHLGDRVVRGELTWAAGRERRGARALAGLRHGHELTSFLRHTDGALWSSAGDREAPLYSVNAMVHAALAR